jgi:hypothetical protein
METDPRSPQTRQLEAVLAPLGEEEEQQAILSAAASIADISDRYRILGAEVVIEKPSAPDVVPERLLAVFVADYANRRSVRVPVQPTGAAGEIEVLAYEPALHPDEVDEARRIAEQDERLARLVREERQVVGVFSPVSEVGAREVGLHYALPRGDRPAELVATVVVSLVAGEILQLELHGRDSEERG